MGGLRTSMFGIVLRRRPKHTAGAHREATVSVQPGHGAGYVQLYYAHAAAQVVTVSHESGAELPQEGQVCRERVA